MVLSPHSGQTVKLSISSVKRKISKKNCVVVQKMDLKKKKFVKDTMRKANAINTSQLPETGPSSDPLAVNTAASEAVPIYFHKASRNSGGPPINYIFTPGRKVGHTVVYTPDDKQLYFCKNKMLKNTHSRYQCFSYKTKCRASLKMFPNGELRERRGQHNHPDQEQDYLELKFRAELRRMCTVDNITPIVAFNELFARCVVYKYGSRSIYFFLLCFCTAIRLVVPE